MKTEEILKQLHKIEADPAYVRDSRARLILAAASIPQRMTLRVFWTNIVHSGQAMAAIALFLVFAVGGSIWSFVINPVTGWDSKALLAEAQAIDTRIHLAALQYNDPGYERQRLISPNTGFGSIGIALEPGDITPEEQNNSTSTEDVSSEEDGTNPDGSATPGTEIGGEVEGEAESPTSTPAIPEDTTVSVEEALDMLSR